MNKISLKRIKKDIIALQKETKVTIIEPYRELQFTIIGPKETCYEGARFVVSVVLPFNYPFKSPSVAFLTRILHPNVDEPSGAICLDIINQTWSPRFSLVNIYNMFLPQLLRYPNPDDPLNKQAADYYKAGKGLFAAKVKEHIMKYCEDNPDEEY